MSASNPLLVASVSDQVLITAAATQLLSQTVGAGNFALFLYARILEATPLTVSVAWTDGSGAQTQVVLGGAQQPGALPVKSTYLNAAAGTISVTATAGVAGAAAVSAALKAL